MISDISLPAVALVSGVTVALLALTEMDGGGLFQRALSDAAPLRETLVETSCYFKSGFQPEGKGQCTWSQTGGIFKTPSLAGQIQRFRMTICLYFALIMLHLAPLAMVTCKSWVQMPLSPVMDQRIQVSWAFAQQFFFVASIFLYFGSEFLLLAPVCQPVKGRLGSSSRLDCLMMVPHFQPLDCRLFQSFFNYSYHHTICTLYPFTSGGEMEFLLVKHICWKYWFQSFWTFL